MKGAAISAHKTDKRYGYEPSVQPVFVREEW